MGGAKFLRLCRELASGEDWSAALQKLGESYPGDNEVLVYGWAGALALLIPHLPFDFPYFGTRFAPGP